MNVWDDLDTKKAQYEAARDKTHARIMEILERRHHSGKRIDDMPLDLSVGQDEFGWWRATASVKNWFGDTAKVYAYQARNPDGLVSAVLQQRQVA